MTISFTQIYSATNEFSAGNFAIATSFTGDLLGVEVDVKPEYQNQQQIIGYLYQFNGSQQVAYALYSGKTVISLTLPETTSFQFLPTAYLNDSYTLTLSYAASGTVLQGANATPIPTNILALPAEVATIQSNQYGDEANITTLQGDVTTINSTLTTISGEITALQSDVTSIDSSLSTIEGNVTTLQGDVTTLNSEVTSINSSLSSLSTTVSGLSSGDGSSSGSTENYTVLAVSSTLESNKNYLVDTASLSLLLPASPSTGAVIGVAVGNLTTLVLQNTGQQILNLSTLSASGSGNGIILKPYSTIELIYQGAGLWVSSYRSRTINNWEGEPVLSANSVQTYTASALGSYLYDGSDTSGIAAINDGVFSNGVMFVGGAYSYGVVASFESPLALTGFNLWSGQYNGVYNPPNSVSVYSGNTVNSANLLGTVALANTGAEQSFSISDSTPSTQYLFLFTNGSTNLSINELQITGQLLSGGEVVAV